MTYPAYPEYKDSGIPWIGKVPVGWNTLSIRRIVKNHLQGYYDSDGYVSEGVKLLRITDLVGNGKISTQDCPSVKETSDIEKYLLQQGDFCFARTGEAGTFGFIEKSPDSKTVFASYLIRFRFKNIDNRYLLYFFLSNNFFHGVSCRIHGGVNQNIHAKNIKDTNICIPLSPSNGRLRLFWIGRRKRSMT